MIRRYIIPGLTWFLCGFAEAQVRITPLHSDGVETNEPCIAIDPKYPGTQLLGSNVDLVFVSSDGGETWSPRRLEPKEGFYGDPVVFIAEDGTQFLCHLAKNKNSSWPDHFDRIVFERSTDGGATFTSTGVGYNPGKVQDKPWLCVDESKKSPYFGRVYLSWTEFDKYGSNSPTDSSRIRFALSSNGGVSFDTTIVVSDVSGDAADNDFTLEGATVTSGPGGELYMVWSGGGKLWFDKSSDGGFSWGKDRVIGNQKGSWHQNQPGLMRGNSMPFLKADKKGKLYLVYGDESNGDQDVFYLYSKDKGETWSAPVRINDDELGNGRSQYMPNIALDRKKNKVYVVFYDRRNSELNRYTDVYAAELKKDKPGKNLRITNQSFAAPGAGVFMGDYISIAAARGVIRAAYTIYDHEKTIATVEVAHLDAKGFKKPDNDRPLFIQLLQLGDTDQIYIHFRLPGAKSCTLELTRGSQLYYKQLFNPLESPENEVMLPASKFASGVYHMTLSFQGRKVERDIFLERR